VVFGLFTDGSGVTRSEVCRLEKKLVGEQACYGPVLDGDSDGFEHGPSPAVGLESDERVAEFGESVRGDRSGFEGVDDLAGLLENRLEIRHIACHLPRETPLDDLRPPDEDVQQDTAHCVKGSALRVVKQQEAGTYLNPARLRADPGASTPRWLSAVAATRCRSASAAQDSPRLVQPLARVLPKIMARG
jgi:hypothetical protein